jgi:alpha-beta hydrolase superfamily lysophospholipase
MSEGAPCVVESTEDPYNDQWLLIFQVLKKYKIDQQKTPIFLMGRSFGGLIATNMAQTLIGQKMFKALALITPYYRLYNEKLYDLEWKVNLVGSVLPHKMMKQAWNDKPEEFKKKWPFLVNDKFQIDGFTPGMISFQFSQ